MSRLLGIAPLVLGCLFLILVALVTIEARRAVPPSRPTLDELAPGLFGAVILIAWGAHRLSAHSPWATLWSVVLWIFIPPAVGMVLIARYREGRNHTPRLQQPDTKIVEDAASIADFEHQPGRRLLLNEDDASANRLLTIIVERKSWLLRNAVLPKICLNDQTLPAKLGANHFWLPPGMVEVAIYCEDKIKYGVASSKLDLVADEKAILYYAQPVIKIIERGEIGDAPRRHAGAIGAYIFNAVLAISSAGTLILSIVNWINR